MTARRCLVLAAALALLAAGVAAASTPVLVAVIGVALAVTAVAAPVQPDRYRRRSTLIAVPGVAHASSIGAGDGPHPEGATS